MKKISLVVLPAITIALEILPLGAVCIFAPSPTERVFALFDKIILPPFSLHVNHVKLFHLVVLTLRSVRDPGRSPCPDALLRVGVMRG